MKSIAWYIDDWQAHGRYVFTTKDLSVADSRSSVAVEAALRRLKKSGRIACPRRGFYVIVPVEYKEAGSPPPSWYIDDLMTYLVQPYYVALLSAAAIHGAGHQQPMVFQVMTDRPTRDMQAGRARIGFHQTQSMDKVSMKNVQTETGVMRVSTPETTALDLVKYSDSAGGISNVATVLGELSEVLDRQKFIIPASAYTSATIQRLGFLLTLVSSAGLSEPLNNWLLNRRYRRILLDPNGDKDNLVLDSTWRIMHSNALDIEG